MMLWLALFALLVPTAAFAGVSLSGPFVLPENRGGFGIDISGQSGYPKNTAGAFAFSATIPGADLVLTATACTNQFVSAISSIGIGTCTTDTLAGAQHANQGTATTLLHGNAAGNPSWGAVVSADLNITTTTCTNQFIRSLSSGAVGTCATVANADLANSTITLNAGSSVGLTAPGAMSLGSTYTIGTTTDTVRLGSLGLGAAAGTVGDLQVAVGLYGISLGTTASTGSTVTFSATTLSWGIGSTWTAHRWYLGGTQKASLTGTGIFDAVAGYTYNSTAISGHVLRGNGTAFIDAALGFSDLSGSAACSQLPALTGNVTTSVGACATTIAAGVVTNAMLAGSIAASNLIGTDIATLGTVTTGTWHATVIAGLYGGTGLSTAAVGDLLYASATTPTWSRLADVATGSVLVSGGVNTAPAWSSSPTLGGLLTVSGSGASNFSGGVNGQQAVIVTNTTSGTGAYSEFHAVAGTNDLLIQAYSQGYTTSGPLVASGAAFYVTGAGGTSLVSAHASGDLRIYTGGTIQQVKVDSAGQIFATALKTTGSAGSKKVVCVDTSTGQLYASSTSTDCSN